MADVCDYKHMIQSKFSIANLKLIPLTLLILLITTSTFILISFAHTIDLKELALMIVVPDVAVVSLQLLLKYSVFFVYFYCLLVLVLDGFGYANVGVVIQFVYIYGGWVIIYICFAIGRFRSVSVCFAFFSIICRACAGLLVSVSNFTTLIVNNAIVLGLEDWRSHNLKLFLYTLIVILPASNKLIIVPI